MSLNNNLSKILIVDFGSQFTQLIARRIREFGVFSEIISHKKIKVSNIIKKDISGIILSGGPSTVTKKKFQSVPKEIFKKKIPILGICYGLQLIAKLFGGEIKPSKKKKRIWKSFLI